MKKVKKNQITIIFFILMFSMTVSCELISEKSEEVVQWERWQKSLISEVIIEPQEDTLRVFFTGPNGISFNNYAFTNDGKNFNFRAAFPKTGKWQWRTEFSDTTNARLHDIEGRVKVMPYNGNNLLYKHGYLQVSENGRYLVHADGTPFLWIGDSGWSASLKSSIQEWRDYIDKRVDQGFSVIQLSPRGAGTGPEGRAHISIHEDGTIDPEFWEDLEKKIGYANDQGIILLIVEVGKHWRDLLAQNLRNQPFITYLTGRLSPYMVILSPSFDQRYDPELEKVGEELKKINLHLVTQHSGTHYETNQAYRDSPSVDFSGLQTGHQRGNLINAYRSARTWTLDMWNSYPVKPVINIETMYDGYGHNEAENWREKDVRKLGWIAWLSGSMGYTYGAGMVPPRVPEGAGGVWAFNLDSTTYDFWRNAMNWDSANQMTVMKEFFESIEWWRLAPAHELVLNQAENDTLKMVVSVTKERDLLLAYLPDNPVIKLDLSDFKETITGKWLNPINGDYYEISRSVVPSEIVSFLRPEDLEDALLILSD